MKNIQKRSLILVGYMLSGCVDKMNTSTSKLEIANSTPKYQIKKNNVQKEYRLVQPIFDNFTSLNQDGEKFELKTFLNKGPVVFIGILNGCPCNEKAQPIINNLAKRYENKATFIGLMPGKEKYLAKYFQKTKCVHYIVLDKQYTIISALDMESSGFIGLVEKKQQIFKLWPGYSISILKELDQDLSYLTKEKHSAFDPQYAPVETTCGCPYTKT